MADEKSDLDGLLGYIAKVPYEHPDVQKVCRSFGYDRQIFEDSVEMIFYVINAGKLNRKDLGNSPKLYSALVSAAESIKTSEGLPELKPVPDHGKGVAALIPGAGADGKKHIDAATLTALIMKP